jgi:hypothetical protein
VGQLIKQRGFADVRAPDQGNSRSHGAATIAGAVPRRRSL